jgi:hypothetical protein
MYTGTVAFAYAFKMWKPENFYFYFGNKIPSARCTLVEKKAPKERPHAENEPSEIKDTYYVQLMENEVGLDANFYQFRNKYSEFDKKLWAEFTKEKHMISDEKEFLDILDVAEEIEKNIEKRMLSNLQLINALKQITFIHGAPIQSEFQFPEVVNMWREYMLKKIQPDVKTVSLEKIKTYLTTIQEKQNEIDSYLAKLRKPIENVHSLV